MHVERVAGRRAVGPGPAREHVARHDRAEPVEQRPGERLLDRRQRHPRVVVAEQPVVVDLGAGAVGARPRLQRAAAGVERRLGRARRDPVFEAIGGDGRFGAVARRAAAGARPGRADRPAVADRWASARAQRSYLQRTGAIVSPTLRRGDGRAASARQVGGRRERPEPRTGTPDRGRAARPARSRRARRRPGPPTRTGALTLATPGSRSPTVAAQPAARTSASTVGIDVEPVAVGGPREQHPPAGSLGRAASPRRGHRVAQAGRALVRRDAHPLIALAHVELRALTGVGAQPLQHGAGRLDQRERRAGRRAPTDEPARRAGTARRRRAPRARGARARPRAGARSAAARPVSRTRSASVHGPGRAIASRMPTARSSVWTPARAPRRYTVHSTDLIVSLSETTGDGAAMANTPHDPLREGLGPPRRALGGGRARPALHRPAPRARGHLAPGLRRAAPRGPRRAPPRPHRRDDGPQRADRRPRPAARGPDLGEADRGARRATARSSASAATRWAIPARASCT